MRQAEHQPCAERSAASMRPRGQTPRMPRHPPPVIGELQIRASMRPRGQTPRMRTGVGRRASGRTRFNEAAGADPADARGPDDADERQAPASMRPRGQTPRMLEGRGAGLGDPPRASMRPRGQTPRMPVPDLVSEHAAEASMRPRGQTPRMLLNAVRREKLNGCFNEAAGADPADAAGRHRDAREHGPASMRPRGQTPRMLDEPHPVLQGEGLASMRPRGQTPRMLCRRRRPRRPASRFNEAAGADPADARDAVAEGVGILALQ